MQAARSSEAAVIEALVRSGRSREFAVLKPNPAFERTANGGAARCFNQGERRRCLPLNSNVGLLKMSLPPHAIS